MSASNTRRRLSLLTGGSMLAALVMAGAGLAPTAVFAANECGDPGTNTTANDTFTCNGSFAAITYPLTNGNLTLNLQNNLTTTTGGLVVTASGNNTVTISRIADSPANSGDPSLTGASGAGLQVISAAGGTIAVTLSDNDTTDAPLVVSGTTAGVLLRNALPPTGVANTGFTSTNGVITASAGAGLDITTTSLGGGTVTITNGSAVTGSTYGIRMGSAGTGNLTITNNGSATGGTGAILVTGGLDLIITNNVARTLTGAVTLNNTGSVRYTNNGAWIATGTSALGAGITTLTNSASGVIETRGAATLDFGAGSDTFTSAGVLAVGSGPEAATTLTFASLETWNNSGIVLLGANGALTASDGVTNDRIVSAATAYDGQGGRLVMDVDLAGDQASCAAAVAADCLDMQGAATSGLTTIVVNSVGGPLEPGHRLVLVDLGSQGTSAADNFSLDATAPGYRQVGAVSTIESGPLFYALVYDETAREHALVTGFNNKAFALSRIGRASTEPWRTSTGMWESRQSDLRDTLAGRAQGTAPGVWLKLAGAAVSEKHLDVGAAQVEYDAKSSQRTQALVGGVDLVRMTGENSAWVFGVTAGALQSTLKYGALDADLDLDGRSLGAYASLVAGRLFVDAIFNTTDLDFTHMESGVAYEGAASSSGYQVEGGFRLFEVNDGGVYIEPLAAIASVETDVDDLAVGTVTTRFDEASSLRGALGLRVAGGMEMDALMTRLAFTGRVWKEFNGENQTTLSGAFGSAGLLDASLETLGDVGVNLGLFAPGGRWSANLGYSLKFGENYQSNDASLSVRLQF